jgi:hypothetical protein
MAVFVVGAIMAIAFGRSSAASGQEKRGLPDEFREASDWFDGLGLPDVSGRPFVKVVLRVASGEANEARSAIVRGFILTDSQGVKSLLTTDLRLLTVSECATDRHVLVKRGRLADYARAAMKEGDVYEEARSQLFWEWEMGFYFTDWSRATELGPTALDFVLARACLKNSLGDLGATLAGRAVDRGWRFARSGRLKDNLRLHLGMVFLNRAIVGLANPATPRREVLARLEWLLRNDFDNPPDRRKEAEEMVSILREMVEEDDRKRGRLLGPAGGPPTPEQLAYSLRDQTGGIEGTHHFVYSVEMSRPPWLVTPAEQLLAMGDRAVPALIEAVDDKRLTRIVGLKNRHRPWELAPTSVGDCARNLLGKIWRDWPDDETREGLGRFWQDKQKETQSPDNQR